MIHVIMIPNHEVVISFGGETKGQHKLCNCYLQLVLKIYFCKYVVVTVITHKLGPKQPKYVYKTQTKCVP